ncbi:MAG TPA: redoxin domain-containing protein [Lacipirellulaceae bacterium]|nr:redoxin domain-containing protein [Lacipirellulaceae bacterium]
MTREAKVGIRAPGFTLSVVNGSGSELCQATLDDYLDRRLLLMFYPRDFSFVCPTELTAVSDRFAEFCERQCDVLAVSTDTIDTQVIGRPEPFAGILCESLARQPTERHITMAQIAERLA